MNIVILIIGTILTCAFILALFKGKKYDYMLENLSGDDFPLKSIYSVGLTLQDTKLFKLRGKVGEVLRKDTMLMYSKQYSEYYARIIWAQILSISLLCMVFFFILAGLSSGSLTTFLIVVGLILAILSAYYFGTYTKEKISKRQEECEAEFPNAISKMALIVNSGVILHEAWEIVAYGRNGTFYDLMKKSCEEMKSGKADIDAIYEFGILTNSDDIKKFTSALIQSVERGGGDLPIFLANQSSEIWDRKRQYLLQKGEKAAGALLMPIALMFFGVMLIVISAAMQSFSL